MKEYLLSERRENLITTLRLDILQVNIVTKRKLIIYTCVFYYIGNISILLDFRPTSMYTRNYHNDTNRAVTTNYVSVSDKKKSLFYIRDNIFQVRFFIPVLVVKCDVMCTGGKQCRNSAEN